MARLVWIGLLLLAALGVAAWRWTVERAASGSQAAVGAAPDLPHYWDVPEFTFVDQHQRRITPRELRGSVWIANFVFTRCTTICPAMSARMVQLQRELAADELRFVSFSVDPAHDTPEVLAAYAERWSPSETRWILLATKSGELERTARAIGVTVEATGDVQDPILHSNRFFLIDPRGVVRGVYSSDDEEALRRLAAEARALVAAEFSRGAPGPRKPLDGAGLYRAYGCAACHADARLAPPLAGLLGRQVVLADGTARVADERYLTRSIREPAAELVAGWGPTMPSYAEVLAEDEIASLVAHVAGLEAPAGAAGAETPIEAQDPVCRMKVRAVSATPSWVHRGARYYFCCEECLADFRADPAKFVGE